MILYKIWVRLGGCAVCRREVFFRNFFTNFVHLSVLPLLLGRFSTAFCGILVVLLLLLLFCAACITSVLVMQDEVCHGKKAWVLNSARLLIQCTDLGCSFLFREFGFFCLLGILSIISNYLRLVVDFMCWDMLWSSSVEVSVHRYDSMEFLIYISL